MIYCIAPRDLPPRVCRSLRRYGEEAGVEVIFECRSAERRGGGERRSLDNPETQRRERRAIRSGGGRRVGERRATMIPVPAPAPLPRRMSYLEDRLVFAEAIELAGEHVEDADTARLVTRIQGGEKRLFGALYERYFDRVYTYLKVALEDRQEAEDLTQQVFIQVMEALPTYELGEAPFRSWLFRVVRSASIDHGLQQWRVEFEDPGEIDPRRELLGRQIDPRVFGWLSDQDLFVLVSRMPLAQRQVMVLRYMMRLNSPQIANVLDRSPAAVSQLQQRALNFLRDRLAAVGRYPRLESVRLPAREVYREMVVINSRRLALAYN